MPPPPLTEPQGHLLAHVAGRAGPGRRARLGSEGVCVCETSQEQPATPLRAAPAPALGATYRGSNGEPVLQTHEGMPVVGRAVVAPDREVVKAAVRSPAADLAAILGSGNRGLAVDHACDAPYRTRLRGSAGPVSGTLRPRYWEGGRSPW